MDEITEYAAAPSQPVREITDRLFLDFVEWIDRSPKTTETYLINLRQFMTYMLATGNTRPERADIIAYRDYLVNKNLKPATIAAYLRSVKQFFSWTAAAGIYPNVAENVRVPKVDHSEHKRDALTVSEVLTVEQSIEARAEGKTMTAACAVKDRVGRIQRSREQGKRLFAMYLLATNAGLRTVEISRANVRDLVMRNGQSVLYIWGKGRSEPDQKKPLAEEVAAAIRDYLRTRSDHFTGDSPLFVSTGNRSGGQRIATRTISAMLKQAMQDAGFYSERLTAHSLRHACGTATMQLTGDLYQTQKYMRHANPATTEIYLHNETERQEAETAQQLYDLYHGKKTKDGALTTKEL